MNMKKYSQAPAKGFTLVELIVVIVILAILATIAFLSFGSQSAAARDSKRKTDLSNLASKMNIAMANGTTVLGLVTSNGTQRVSGTLAKIAGTGVINTTDYDAGTINFNVLGVAAGDFADPQTGTYKIGATSNAGSAFQLAATLENDNAGNSGKNGFVVGNYSARTATTASGTIPTGTFSTGSSSTTIPLPTGLVGTFKKNDWIRFQGSVMMTGQVSNVSSDLGTITLNSAYAGTSATGTLYLLADEMSGLVASTASGQIGVSNGSPTYFPY